MTALQDDYGLLPDVLVPYFSTVIKEVHICLPYFRNQWLGAAG